MDPFGEDKFHISNADKAQERGRYGVTRSVGPSLWIPPRLVKRWLFYPLPDLPDRSRYSGKNACTCNQVKIVFQLSRDVEVYIGAAITITSWDFSSAISSWKAPELPADAESAAHRSDAVTNQFAIQYRNRICSQVTHGDSSAECFSRHCSTK